MAETSYRVRLDPWAAEYEGAIQLEDGEPTAEVDLGVEKAAWEPVSAGVAPPPRRIVFIDGVRRIEHRLLVEEPQRTVFGLLGSFAVGAAVTDGAVQIAHERLVRIACTGGGLRLERLEAHLPNGGPAIVFEPEAVAENTPVAPLQGLQSAMRRAEAALAQELSDEVDLVFLDGPLTFLAEARRPIVGFVKRLVRAYLPPAASAILSRLEVGERTPLFLIADARHPRYSWYARIAFGRAIDSSLTGVVRLEASEALGLAAVRALADASAGSLPRFASRSGYDPRAPQNLYPIGGLEATLRHRLGDHHLIRRAIEVHLQAGVPA